MLPRVSSETLPTILIVDDEEDDLFFLRRKVAASGVRNPIVTFNRPVELIQFLRGGLPPHGEGPRPSVMPCLILSDIKMPEMTGFEVLRWIRAQVSLHDVTVVIVSGSSLDEDRSRAKELGADGYLVKFPDPAILADWVSTSMSKTRHRVGR